MHANHSIVYLTQISETKPYIQVRFPFLDVQQPTRSIGEDSPYPEVRSAVANFDDPSMPIATFRACILSLVLGILIASVNMFLFFRIPSVAVDKVCLSFPSEFWLIMYSLLLF